MDDIRAVMEAVGSRRARTARRVRGRDVIRALRGHLSERVDALIIYRSTANWADALGEPVLGS